MIRTRLAPTPSGLLHPGNGVSFLVTWALARAAGGWILLRVDDLDGDRYRPEYLEDIFRTIDWLGIDYDAGPQNIADFEQHWSQHLRIPQYNDYLHQLREKGLLYACTCSRREIREQSHDGLYPGTCRLAQKDWDGPETAWRVRLDTPAKVTYREWQLGEQHIAWDAAMGDFVVRQKNELPAYQIASLADDLRWDINFVVRGRDLKASTGAQVWLANALNENTFQDIIFWHHPLLLDASGEKLSKSKGAAALQHWREDGRPPTALYQEAARWLGLDVAEVIDAPSLLDALNGRSEE